MSGFAHTCLNDNGQRVVRGHLGPQATRGDDCGTARHVSRISLHTLCWEFRYTFARSQRCIRKMNTRADTMPRPRRSILPAFVVARISSRVAFGDFRFHDASRPNSLFLLNVEFCFVVEWIFQMVWCLLPGVYVSPYRFGKIVGRCKH